MRQVIPIPFASCTFVARSVGLCGVQLARLRFLRRACGTPRAFLGRASVYFATGIGIRRLFLFLLMTGVQATCGLALADEEAGSDAPAPVPTATKTVNEDPKFQEKLTDMLARTEKSLKLIREQILQNQSAPFLANLYLQLGDLLAQKSTTLYYMQMERDKNTDLKVQATKKFSPVVVAQKEAISVYEQILREFPKFDKRDKVMYRLAISEKSIDEGAAFVATAERLIKTYPQSKEATQARLMLGQHFFDMQDLSEALKHLKVVMESQYPFERDAARYRVGVIYIQQEKHAEALQLFAKVATDDELKDEDNPLEVSLKTKTVSSNVKREALIDSVRAYTQVYKTNPDPVGFYSRIAPTESLFQETIEKLAYRYIFLKNYSSAIRLLRTLSERTADPQKVVNVYHEVLLMIPVNDRIDLPVEEMQFVLEKYNYYITHYTVTADTKNKMFDFFETQIRELGTHAHDLAKAEKDFARKKHLFERARLFYHLYLAFFEKGPRAVKIAINLGDVYYNQGNYLESGSFYLRVFSGEFGTPTEKVALIQNSILVLQKSADYSFYEQLRVKGLLVKAIRTYMAFDPKQQNDPGLNFSLCKIYYEQGFYDHALDDLLQYMKRFPNSRDVENATDLILSYFNTRSDFKGLTEWTQKILALNLPNTKLNQRLKDTHAKAVLRKLDEQIKTTQGFDMFAQGKTYLQTALASSDLATRSVALEQALGRSKAERDIDTFLAAAGAMANSERSPAKKGEIYSSMADESLAVTRFARALAIWDEMARTVPAAKTSALFEKKIRLLLMLHDTVQLGANLSSPQMNAINSATKKSLQQQLMGMMDSTVALPPVVYNYLVQNAANDDDWSALAKSAPKMPEQSRQQVLRNISSRCGDSLRFGICKRQAWPRTAAMVSQFAQAVARTPGQLANVEPTAGKMNVLLDEIKRLEGSADPQLDAQINVAASEVYRQFAGFLQRTAQANKEVAAILNQKAKESLTASAQSQNQCLAVVRAAPSIPQHVCHSGVRAQLEVVQLRQPSSQAPSISGDPHFPEAIELQKKIFVDRKNWRNLFDLAELYLKNGYYNHAAAASIYGLSSFRDDEQDFGAILGCAVGKMGFLGEGLYHLEKAGDINNHKQVCMAEFKQKRGER
ncbi:MAG: hypothetical protein C5B49_06410 [Bdellovibrio sp.]|nr:MAG: hypothetical protein C5B49_06410 [Bdellovibrio sp.]